MAAREDLKNFSILSAHKWVVPAMDALLAGGEVRIDGFICPGHVSVIIGSRAYEGLARQYRRPCVVAGFTPEQVLAGVAAILRQLAAGEARVENVYRDAVRPEGNPEALARIGRVFEPAPAMWRGLAVIPASGMAVRQEFAEFDTARRLGLEWPPSEVDTQRAWVPLRRRHPRRHRAARLPALRHGLHPRPPGRPVHGQPRGLVPGRVQVWCGLSLRPLYYPPPRFHSGRTLCNDEIRNPNDESNSNDE